MNESLRSRLATWLVISLGIFLFVFSVMAVIQGLLTTQVNFKQGRFGFEVRYTPDNKALLIYQVVDDLPADRAGLRVGDLILEIGGKPVGEWDSRLLWANATGGTSMHLRVLRGDRQWQLVIHRQLLHVLQRLLNAAYQFLFPLILLAYVVVGLWGLFKQPSFITRLIALVCFGFGISIYGFTSGTLVVTTFLSQHFYFYQLKSFLSEAGLIIAPGFWLFLFLNFPVQAHFYKKHKIPVILAVFLIPVVVFPSLFLFFEARVVELVTVLVFFIYIMAGMFLLSRRARGNYPALTRRQFRLMLFGIRVGGVAIFMGMAIFYAYFLLLRVGVLYVSLTLFLFFIVSQLIGLVLPFTFLNSFFQHHILQTESALRRRLRYLLSSLFLFALYLSVCFLLGRWAINLLKLTEPTFIIMITLVLSLTFYPLQVRLLRWLEERLYPEKTRYKKALSEMVKRFASHIEESEILASLHHCLSEIMGLFPIQAVVVDAAGNLALPLKSDSPGSVLAKINQGSYFLWDEVREDGREQVDEEERQWALEQGISITLPLIARGQALGVLNIGKKRNHEDFTGDDLEIFNEAAFHTALALQNIRLQIESLEKKRMVEELEVARQVQNRLVPHTIPEVPGFEIHGHYQPCYEVGGDYYDIIQVDGERTLLVIADVSGKGAGAALLMSNLHASLHMAITVALPLHEIVARINQQLYENSPSSKFITFFIGEWHNRDKVLRYINAGHNPPVLLGQGQQVTLLTATGIGLGIKPNRIYQCREVPIQPGDVLVIYTDGVEDFFNEEGEAFGRKGILAWAQQQRHRPPHEMIAALMDTLEDFGANQSIYMRDDLAVIVAKRIN